MNRSRRIMLVSGLIAGVLLVGAAWSVGWMFEQKANARRAVAEARESKVLAEQIAILGKRPTIAAADETRGQQELDPKITSALQAAGLPQQPTIAGIAPQTARPLGKAPYNIKPTALSLRSMTLAQLATFLYHLSDGTGLNVRDLRMRPARSGQTHQWDAEATVTYLIYSPTNEER